MVAVLSHGLWTRRFGQRPSVIGDTLTLNGRAIEIVGVMPQGFAFPLPRVEAWIPEQISVKQGFGLFGHEGVARLRDGVSLETARVELQGLIAGIGEAYPDDPRATGNVRTRLTFVGQTLKDRTLGGVGRALTILLAAVGVVLLVACANVANLFLVRSEMRQREIAIRRALGAARLGLGRYFLTESALLAIAGGAIGLFVAWAALRMLPQMAPNSLPRMHEIRLEPVAIAYVAALSALAAVIFGAIPLWHGASTSALHESGRGNTATRQRHGVRHLLLGAQVAMALLLLVGSGLMVRSVQNLNAIDPGFNPDSTLTFSVGLQESTVSRRGCRRPGASRYSRARAGAAQRALCVRHLVPAIEHGLQWQYPARRRRDLPAGRTAAIGDVSRGGRRLLRDHGHAHPARPRARSRRRRPP